MQLIELCRTDLDHKSNTAHLPDSYAPDRKRRKMPDNWDSIIRGHACYDPYKVGVPEPWHTVVLKAVRSRAFKIAAGI